MAIPCVPVSDFRLAEGLFARKLCSHTHQVINIVYNNYVAFLQHTVVSFANSKAKVGAYRIRSIRRGATKSFSSLNQGCENSITPRQ